MRENECGSGSMRENECGSGSMKDNFCRSGFDPLYNKDVRCNSADNVGVSYLFYWFTVYYAISGLIRQDSHFQKKLIEKYIFSFVSFRNNTG